MILHISIMKLFVYFLLFVFSIDICSSSVVTRDTQRFVARNFSTPDQSEPRTKADPKTSFKELVANIQKMIEGNWSFVLSNWMRKNNGFNNFHLEVQRKTKLFEPNKPTVLVFFSYFGFLIIFSYMTVFYFYRNHFLNLLLKRRN